MKSSCPVTTATWTSVSVSSASTDGKKERKKGKQSTLYTCSLQLCTASTLCVTELVAPSPSRTDVEHGACEPRSAAAFAPRPIDSRTRPSTAPRRPASLALVRSSLRLAPPPSSEAEDRARPHVVQHRRIRRSASRAHDLLCSD